MTELKKNIKESVKSIERVLYENSKQERIFYNAIEPILRDYFATNKKESFNQMAIKLNVSKRSCKPMVEKIYLPKGRVGQLLKLYNQ